MCTCLSAMPLGEWKLQQTKWWTINSSFSIVLGYDCHKILKHVSKPYNLFHVMHNSRKQVVGLIYMKQFVLWAWCKEIACDSCKSKLYHVLISLKLLLRLWFFSWLYNKQDNKIRFTKSIRLNDNVGPWKWVVLMTFPERPG
jgi:hypothetical protein